MVLSYSLTRFAAIGVEGMGFATLCYVQGCRILCERSKRIWLQRSNPNRKGKAMESMIEDRHIRIDGAGPSCEVTEVVRARLADCCHFAHHWREISCSYEKGVLTLQGRVPSFYLKQVLQTTLRGIPGVDRIDNRVDVVELEPGDTTEPEITGGYIWKKDKDPEVASTERPFSTRYNDAQRLVDPSDPPIRPELMRRRGHLPPAVHLLWPVDWEVFSWRLFLAAFFPVWAGSTGCRVSAPGPPADR